MCKFNLYQKTKNKLTTLRDPSKRDRPKSKLPFGRKENALGSGLSPLGGTEWKGGEGDLGFSSSPSDSKKATISQPPNLSQPAAWRAKRRRNAGAQVRKNKKKRKVEKVKKKKVIKIIKQLRIYYRNFNSIKTLNQKTKFLEHLKYAQMTKVQMIILAETCARDIKNLVLKGYNLVHADFRTKVEGSPQLRCEVAIYIRECVTNLKIQIFVNV